MKKFMFVNRKAPYGTIYALESLEVVLITATFDQDVSLVFIDDGVYELVKGQDTQAIGIKNHSKTYRALEGYDVEALVRRRGGRPRMGSAPAQVVPVRIDPELRAAVAARAEADATTASDVIREALRRYLVA